MILELLINNGEMYGLEMVKASGGQLKCGTAYVTLARISDKGCVKSYQVKEAILPPNRCMSSDGDHQKSIISPEAATGPSIRGRRAYFQRAKLNGAARKGAYSATMETA